jgi:hypothetical protein
MVSVLHYLASLDEQAAYRQFSSGFTPFANADSHKVLSLPIGADLGSKQLMKLYCMVK